MLKGIGKIVASACKRLRVDVQALARKASVDGAKSVALEKGLPGMTTTELARVAEQLELLFPPHCCLGVTNAARGRASFSSIRDRRTSTTRREGSRRRP